MYIKNLLKVLFKTKKTEEEIFDLLIELNAIKNDDNINKIDEQYFKKNHQNYFLLSFVNRKKHIIYFKLFCLSNTKYNLVFSYNLSDNSYHIDKNYIDKFNEFYNEKFNFKAYVNDINSV